jgi:predicted nucleic acid-binding protein
MRYVLDASVGFKWAIIEVDTIKARRLRDDYRNGVHTLIAPDFFPVEVAHSLTRAERQRRITPAEGARAFFDVAQTLPQLLPSFPRASARKKHVNLAVFRVVLVCQLAPSLA